MGAEELDISQSAAILCPHVAVDKVPILFARRDEPAFPEDSGWQFTCGAEHGEDSEGKIWCVKDVLSVEPSLNVFMSCPEDTEITRQDITSEWIILNDGQPYVKLYFHLDKIDENPSLTTESLWAIKVGPSKYQVDNTPFFVRNISPGDIVEGAVNGGELFFSSLLTRSGSSVLWLKAIEESKTDVARAQLREQGCNLEGAGILGRIAVEVPANVSLQAVINTIEKHQNAWLINYDLASLRHTLPAV